MATKPGSSKELDDPLEGSPALPPLPNSKTAASPSIPSVRSASSDGGTRELAVIGAQPSAQLLNGMQTIEQNVQAIAKHIPGFLDFAQPFIDQMRAMGAARLAEMMQGGTGGLSPEAVAPNPATMAPAPGGAGMGMGMGAGSGVPPMPLPM